MSTLSRLGIYAREQLEPGTRLLLSFAITAFVFLLMILHETPGAFSWQLLVPALSTWLLLLYYRISDEFKDYETDLHFFPDRPIPSGRVKLQDLKILLVIVSAVGVLLNVSFPWASKEYLAAYIFTVLMGKWFFMESLISKNRLLAFFTHGPVGIFLYWYLIQFIANLYQIKFTYAQSLSLIGYIVIPGFVWEILRKTYLPQDEMPGYQTYSQMLGFRGSLFFGGIWILLSLINDYFFFSSYIMLKPLIPVIFVIQLLMLLLTIKHGRIPWTKNLRIASEIYMTAHLLIPLGYLIYHGVIKGLYVSG